MISNEISQILHLAVHEAKSRQHSTVSAEHILFSCLQTTNGKQILTSFGADTTHLLHELEVYFLTLDSSDSNLLQLSDDDHLSAPVFRELFQFLMIRTAQVRSTTASLMDLILALSATQKTRAAALLHKNCTLTEADLNIDSTAEDISLPYGLLRYSSVDFAVSSPVYGRTAEITQIFKTMCCKFTNNTLILGETSIGKTSLLHETLYRLQRKAPTALLRHIPIFWLDIPQLLAGTVNRGQIEDYLLNISAFLTSQPLAVLAADDIHGIAPAAVPGRDYGFSALANLLPVLRTPRIITLFTAKTSEYRQRLSSNLSIVHAFRPLILEPISDEDTLTTLAIHRKTLEEHFHTKISSEVLQQCIMTSKSVFPTLPLPTAAVMLLDYSLSTANGAKELTHETLQLTAKDLEQSSEATTQLFSKSKVHASADFLHSKVFGQPEAIQALCDVVYSSFAGLSAPGRPIGSFLFTGPSGVGKTELCIQLAEAIDFNLIRFDMSEYSEKHSISKLIGAPPGYVGYEQGGQLVEKIKKFPKSVILIDEIEKSHPEIQNSFLQILDHATLTDSSGCSVDFSNSIIIFTSNFGSANRFYRPATFVPSAETDISNKTLAKFFTPEFQNRLTSIINFNLLVSEDVLQIIVKELEVYSVRLATRGLKLSYDDSVLTWILNTSFKPEFGARDIRRFIEDSVVSKIATHLVFDTNASLASSLHLFYTANELRLEFLTR